MKDASRSRGSITTRTCRRRRRRRRRRRLERQSGCLVRRRLLSRVPAAGGGGATTPRFWSCYSLRLDGLSTGAVAQPAAAAAAAVAQPAAAAVAAIAQPAAAAVTAAAAWLDGCWGGCATCCRYGSSSSSYCYSHSRPRLLLPEALVWVLLLQPQQRQQPLRSSRSSCYCRSTQLWASSARWRAHWWWRTGGRRSRCECVCARACVEF